jgi:uncharacterized membrane protein
VGTFEAWVGGRAFLVVGVVVALFGLGWFLKFAIDRGWLDPRARVLLGSVAGVVALVLGNRLRTRGWRVYGQGLMGGGLGALFLCTWFAEARYDLMGTTPAYAIVGLLAAAGAVLALRCDAPLLAYLGFAGGFLAPAILSPGEDLIFACATWLGILDLGILAVASRRPWRGLDWMALAASTWHLSAWAGAHYDPARLWSTTGILAVLLLLSLATALAPPLLRREPPGTSSLWAALVAGGLGILGGALLLHPDHRRLLGTGVLGLSAIYHGAGRLAAARCGAKDAPGVLAAMTLLSFVLAVPFLFEGRAVGPAWSLAGFVLLLLSLRGGPSSASTGGTILMALGAAEVVLLGRWLHDPGAAAVFNPAFACALLVAAPLVAAGEWPRRSSGEDERGAGHLLVGAWLLLFFVAGETWQAVEAWTRPGGGATEHLPVAAAGLAVSLGALAAAATVRARPDGVRTAMGLPALVGMALGLAWMTTGRKGAFSPLLNGVFLCGIGNLAAGLLTGLLLPERPRRVFHAAGAIFLVLLSSAEILAWGDRRPLEGIARTAARFRAQVWLSVSWALHGAAFVGLGFPLRRAELRWIGIALFALTLGKVFLHDMARLDTVYRIGSFLALGVLLVLASFLYQRRRTTGSA